MTCSESLYVEIRKVLDQRSSRETIYEHPEVG